MDLNRLATSNRDIFAKLSRLDVCKPRLLVSITIETVEEQFDL